jgi:hypothetical protein
MRPLQRLIPLGLAVLLAACQAAQPTQPGQAGPQAPATMPPGTQPTESITPTAQPTAATVRVQLSGKIYDDEGRVLTGATLKARSSDGAYSRDVEVIAGAYAIPDAPLGAPLTLQASLEGYTARERVHTPTLPRPDEDRNPNVVDFGGSGGGAYFALSQYPEISRILPANQQVGVPASPLIVTFTLSRPLPVDERGRFANLFQLRFQVPTEVHPTGEIILRPGVAYEETVASLTWNEAGTEGTFSFGAPIVTRGAAASAVTVGFNQEASLDVWPQTANNKMLGRGRAQSTYSGNGTTVSNQVAPFWRGTDGLVAPSARPSPLALWGSTHMTTSSFSLAADSRRPRVKEVSAFRGAAGLRDTIVITFDEPIRGYPESALDGSAVRASNYRYVLGDSEDADDIKRFNETNVASGGNTPTSDLTYSRTRNDTVIITLPVGALAEKDVFKLYVDPAVKDVQGNGVQTSAQDPVTGLADHIIQGKII